MFWWGQQKKLLSLSFLVFSSFLMWVFDRWSPYSYQNNREKYKDDEEKREFNLKECLWFCMTSLTPQVRAARGSALNVCHSELAGSVLVRKVISTKRLSSALLMFVSQQAAQLEGRTTHRHRNVGEAVTKWYSRKVSLAKREHVIQSAKSARQ
jgi:hypothetical protein